MRAGLITSLDQYAAALFKFARLFDRHGAGRSGFHMVLSGKGTDARPKTVCFFIVARSGHGPIIPCIPAILLARRLARGQVEQRGAIPCLDLITLDEYLAELKDYDIETFVEGGSNALLPATAP